MYACKQQEGGLTKCILWDFCQLPALLAASIILMSVILQRNTSSVCNMLNVAGIGYVLSRTSLCKPLEVSAM